MSTKENSTNVNSIEIKDIKKKVAENQLSVIIAFKNLWIEIQKKHNGDESDVNSAFYGLLNAYFRPRIILSIGAISGVVIAVLQLLLFDRQTDLIEKQTGLFSFSFLFISVLISKGQLV